MPRQMSDELTFHKASGQWVKQVRRKVYYFGADENEAKVQWLADKPYILTGRVPPRSDGSPTVVELANLYYAHQQRQLDADEIGLRHSVICKTTMKRFIEIVGEDCRPQNLSPLEWSDIKAKLFEPVKRDKPVRGTVYGRTVKRRSNETVAGDVRRIRAFLSWCFDTELIPVAPRWGKLFSPTTKSATGKTKADTFTGFEPERLRTIIESASVQFRPIILLGINAGLGGYDISTMKMDALPKLKSKSEKWVSLPRMKTGTDRRFPLWPETVEAINKYLVWRKRPLRQRDTDLVFITATGNPWIEVHEQGAKDSIGTNFRKLRIDAGLKAGTFYDLRRQFQTTAAETLDFPAVKFVMGHEKKSRDMSERYSLRIDDERVRAVVNHVRQWLFGEVAK